MLADYMLSDIKAFRWACKYISDPSLMPDLKWQNSSVGYVQTLDENLNITKKKYGSQQ